MAGRPYALSMNQGKRGMVLVVLPGAGIYSMQPSSRRQRPTNMRNAGWLAVLAVAVLTGCATAHVGERAAPAGNAAPSTHAVPAIADAGSRMTPRQRAVADAAKMLAAFIAPPRAVRTAPLRVPVLAQAPTEPMSPDVVIRTGWWRVPGQPQDVLSWVEAHKPAGFTESGSGSSGTATAQESYATFSLPDVPGALLERQLLAEVAADGPEQTAIRVDAEDLWVPAKLAAELIPATAAVVTITPLSAWRPAAKTDRQVTITDPSKAARIAAAVNALPVFPPYSWIECGPGPGPGMRLTFRATPTGPALAVVTAYQQLCPLVQVVTGGKKMPALDGSETLFQQVMGIAGFHWADFPAPGPTTPAPGS